MTTAEWPKISKWKYTRQCFRDVPVVAVWAKIRYSPTLYRRGYVICNRTMHVDLLLACLLLYAPGSRTQCWFHPLFSIFFPFFFPRCFAWRSSLLFSVQTKSPVFLVLLLLLLLCRFGSSLFLCVCGGDGRPSSSVTTPLVKSSQRKKIKKEKTSWGRE